MQKQAIQVVRFMTALYYDEMTTDAKNPHMDNRDRFVLSKGHSVEPLWSILADKGFFPKEELETFSAFGTRLIGHPNNKVPGVEMNTGSLGHGLPVAAGMAVAAKMNNADYRIYTLMGDGEQAEGSIWEGAMFAAHYKLDNLLAIIDRNRLQISGPTEEVMGLEPFPDKWAAFGWHVIQVDGNDIAALLEAFSIAKTVKGKPTVIIANTIKGKGVSFIENQVDWHHHVPTTDQYKTAIEELEAQLKEA